MNRSDKSEMKIYLIYFCEATSQKDFFENLKLFKDISLHLRALNNNKKKKN